MAKYSVLVEFISGRTTGIAAECINFHAGKGGIDIFDDINEIPFFPGKEKDVKKITIVFSESEEVDCW